MKKDAAASLPPIVPPPVVRALSARTRLVTFGDLGTYGSGYPTNVLVVLGARRNFVLDTFLGPDSMKVVKGILAREGARKPTVVFNTHSDWDHVWGNGAFRGATIVAHERCRANLIAHGEEALAHFAAWRRGKVRIVPPDLVFTERLAFPDDGISFLAAPGHTADSAVALIEEEDGALVFAGDNLERPLPWLAQPDLALYRRTLDMLLSLPVKTFIPGHGEPEGKALVRSTMKYLDALESGRDAAYRRGKFAEAHAANRKAAGIA